MVFGFGVGVQRLGSFGVATLAALNNFAPGASLRPTGFVYADPTPANNGVYTWSGAAWVRQRGLPDGLAAFGSVGGTANAITATAQTGVDPATVVAGVLIPAANNTGPATLNGEAITDRSGNPLVADALIAGVAALLFRDGSGWRLITGMVAEISDVSGLSAALASKAVPSDITSAIDALKDGVDAAYDTLAKLATGLAGKISTSAIATAANYIAKTANKVLSPEAAWDAAAEVTITYAATIALDLGAVINGKITLTGNLTLDAPVNQKSGQSGCIRLIQDGAGGKTITFHADFKFPGGTDPALSTAGNTTDLLYYHVVAPNVIHASLIKAIA